MTDTEKRVTVRRPCGCYTDHRAPEPEAAYERFVRRLCSNPCWECCKTQMPAPAAKRRRR